MFSVSKILLVFGGILVLSRLKVPLGLALVLGGIGLDVWAGRLARLPADLAGALVSPELWLMIAITVLVEQFGRYFTDKDNSEAIMSSVRTWGGRHGRMWSLMGVPAMVGLMPMPAGALFSAPLVKQIAGDRNVTRDWKTAVNYWFRHIWESWWPLYPGIVVAMQIFGLPTWKFIGALVLITPVCIAAGYYFLVLPHKTELAGGETTDTPPNGRRLVIMGSILLVMIGGLFVLPELFKEILTNVPRASRNMSAMLAGLVVGAVLIVADEYTRNGRTEFFRSTFQPKALHILFTIAGVMIFKVMLDTSGLVGRAAAEMSGSRLAVINIIAFLPFLAGLITGVSIGYAGAALPLVAGLLNAEGSGLTPMATVALACSAGYIGMLVSPVHLCLLVTRDYFDSSLLSVYRQFIPCAVTVTVFAGILCAVLFALKL